MPHHPDGTPPAISRQDWPARVVRLGAEGDDLLTRTSPEERLAMVWLLTLDAWAFAGLTLPTYSRSEAPVVLRQLR